MSNAWKLYRHRLDETVVYEARESKSGQMRVRRPKDAKSEVRMEKRSFFENYEPAPAGTP